MRRSGASNVRETRRRKTWASAAVVGSLRWTSPCSMHLQADTGLRVGRQFARAPTTTRWPSPKATEFSGHSEAAGIAPDPAARPRTSDLLPHGDAPSRRGWARRSARRQAEQLATLLGHPRKR